MELIILLIVLKILSSLFQSFRGGGKPFPERPGPSPPPGFFGIHKQRKMPDTEVRDDQAQEVLWEGLNEKIETGLGDADWAGQDIQPFLPINKSPGNAERPSWLAPVRGPSVSSGKAVKRKAVDRREPEHGMAKFLEKDSLVRGIIALEVLSPPRARRSFYFTRGSK